ncbi:MAG: SRPBCC family protein [Planctomycetota bacterium]
MIFHELEIHAPAETVFGLVSDFDKMKTWLSSLERTTIVSRPTGDSLAGARFRQRVREDGFTLEYDGVVTAFERPHHFGVRLGGKSAEIEIDYRLAAGSNGVTRLTYRADVTFKTMMARIAGKMYLGAARQRIVKHLGQLRELAERSGGPSAS